MGSRSRLPNQICENKQKSCFFAILTGSSSYAAQSLCPLCKCTILNENRPKKRIETINFTRCTTCTSRRYTEIWPRKNQECPMQTPLNKKSASIAKQGCKVVGRGGGLQLLHCLLHTAQAVTEALSSTSLSCIFACPQHSFARPFRMWSLSPRDHLPVLHSTLSKQ